MPNADKINVLLRLCAPLLCFRQFSPSVICWCVCSPVAAAAPFASASCVPVCLLGSPAAAARLCALRRKIYRNEPHTFYHARSSPQRLSAAPLRGLRGIDLRGFAADKRGAVCAARGVFLVLGTKKNLTSPTEYAILSRQGRAR